MTRAGSTCQVSPLAAIRRHLLYVPAAVAGTLHVVPHCHLFIHTINFNLKHDIFFTYSVRWTEVRAWFSIDVVNTLPVLIFSPWFNNEIAGVFLRNWAFHETDVDLRTRLLHFERKLFFFNRHYDFCRYMDASGRI